MRNYTTCGNGHRKSIFYDDLYTSYLSVQAPLSARLYHDMIDRQLRSLECRNVVKREVTNAKGIWS